LARQAEKVALDTGFDTVAARRTGLVTLAFSASVTL
jgi:hypothetical protein